MLKYGFSYFWLEEGKIGGSGLPSFVSDIEVLYEAGFRGIVSLTDGDAVLSLIKQSDLVDLAHLNLPVIDFGAPHLTDVERFFTFLSKLQKPVLVHCYAGCGRTGTFLALYLLKQGLSFQGAVDKVREVRTCAIETKMQLNFVLKYFKDLTSE